jgi:glutaconyl-CoA/methylmalonyl-CoA decarboxylase subunit gamma
MSKYTFTIGEQTFDVEIGTIRDDLATVIVNQTPYEVRIQDALDGPTSIQAPPAESRPAPAAAKPAAAAPAAAPEVACTGAVVAPIPGTIIELKVKVGEPVTTGQVVGIMEAMKMENNLVSPMDGAVREIRAEKGADVATGDIVMIIG